MNKKLLNTQIEALTEDHGAEVVQFYEDQGFEVGSRRGILCREDDNRKRFYGVDIGGFFSHRRSDRGGILIKTITLEEARALVGEGELNLPCNAWVWDEAKKDRAQQGIVIASYNGKHIVTSQRTDSVAYIYDNASLANPNESQSEGINFPQLMWAWDKDPSKAIQVNVTGQTAEGFWGYKTEDGTKNAYLFDCISAKDPNETKKITLEEARSKLKEVYGEDVEIKNVLHFDDPVVVEIEDFGISFQCLAKKPCHLPGFCKGGFDCLCS